MITSFQDLIQAAGSLLNLILPITVALALLYFLWGLTTFIQKSGDEKAHAEGRSKMVWGVIALFVMFSVWGLVAFLQNELIGGSGTSTSFPIINNN